MENTTYYDYEVRLDRDGEVEVYYECAFPSDEGYLYFTKEDLQKMLALYEEKDVGDD